MIIRTIEEERERLLDRTRRNEASALANARHRNSLEIAKDMIADGMAVDKVARLTRLTTDEVLKL